MRSAVWVPFRAFAQDSRGSTCRRNNRARWRGTRRLLSEITRPPPETARALTATATTLVSCRTSPGRPGCPRRKRRSNSVSPKASPGASAPEATPADLPIGHRLGEAILGRDRTGQASRGTTSATEALRAAGRGAGRQRPPRRAATADPRRKAQEDERTATGFAAFLEAQAAEQGRRNNTLLAYARDLADFTDWLAAGGRPDQRASRAISRPTWFIATIAGPGQATRARRLSAIKQLYAFRVRGRAARRTTRRCDQRALAATNAARNTDRAEVDSLLDAARERAAPRRLRNTCLMEVLYATGMRVSELVSLPLAAAKGDPRMLLIRGKGGRERMVPLSPPARARCALAWRPAKRARTRARRGQGRLGLPVPVARQGGASDAAFDSIC